MQKLLENAKELNTYKRLLQVLGEYSDKFPATGVDKMFNSALEAGMKVIPKDKRAQEILNHVLFVKKTSAAITQELLNMRFSGLPMDIRPVYKVGNRKKVAFWGRGGKIYDKVVSLLDMTGEGGVMSFVDEAGNKVELIDLMDKEEA
jgi:hypothetical protein